jgi:hypothetical protein
LEAQIERHMPSLLGAVPTEEAPIEISAASGLNRLRFARRLRRFKRAA